MSDVDELRATRAAALGALRVMVDGADEDQEFLTIEQEEHFIGACALIDALDTRIRAARASSDYWSGRMGEGEAADLDEPLWVPTPVTAGEQLGIRDKFAPPPRSAERRALWHRLYMAGQLP
jgi:hypothetical protein